MTKATAEMAQTPRRKCPRQAVFVCALQGGRCPLPGRIPPHPPSPTSFLDRGWAGILTFQNRNTLTTLSRENQVLETITLPEEALPGSEYSLDRSDDYILALSNPASMNEPFGVVYYTDRRNGLPCQPHSF